LDAGFLFVLKIGISYLDAYVFLTINRHTDIELTANFLDYMSAISLSAERVNIYATPLPFLAEA
jgi:hypothetical protein